ncbi:hypothetical protein B296_00048577 [Ensete ventricosum]|uniref:Uncharacterized protein n=1 Tax=Ensete ventricosum TaxID=4639 RepID=A0A426YU63_ENSVE|nr:hypothetical protein B296_00048577 [Ensete ventricosum]
MGFILLSRLWWAKAKDFLAFFFILSFPGLATAGREAGREEGRRKGERRERGDPSLCARQRLHCHLGSLQPFAEQPKVQGTEGRRSTAHEAAAAAGRDPSLFSLSPSSASSYYPSRACFCESPMLDVLLEVDRQVDEVVGGVGFVCSLAELLIALNAVVVQHVQQQLLTAPPRDRDRKRGIEAMRTRKISAKPHLLVPTCWAGDYREETSAAKGNRGGHGRARGCSSRLPLISFPLSSAMARAASLVSKNSTTLCCGFDGISLASFTAPTTSSQGVRIEQERQDEDEELTK